MIEIASTQTGYQVKLTRISKEEASKLKMKDAENYVLIGGEFYHIEAKIGEEVGVVPNRTARLLIADLQNNPNLEVLARHFGLAEISFRGGG